MYCLHFKGTCYFGQKMLVTKKKQGNIEYKNILILVNYMHHLEGVGLDVRIILKLTLKK